MNHTHAQAFQKAQQKLKETPAPSNGQTAANLIPKKGIAVGQSYAQAVASQPAQQNQQNQGNNNWPPSLRGWVTR